MSSPTPRTSQPLGHRTLQPLGQFQGGAGRIWGQVYLGLGQGQGLGVTGYGICGDAGHRGELSTLGGPIEKNAAETECLYAYPRENSRNPSPSQQPALELSHITIETIVLRCGDVRGDPRRRRLN
ncbi:hypothetical protein JZ751_023848 [Albula glossodonta]|uniref:Uncharacterized protein n=1 Tax=Albula glossodonta TaxID=121402 RepID=A0A8T2NFZ8_9TELE|nr:hypothetical protein JZ751_023848 [Albula glossodonta]